MFFAKTFLTFFVLVAPALSIDQDRDLTSYGLPVCEMDDHAPCGSCVCPPFSTVGDHVQCLNTLEDCFCDDSRRSAKDTVCGPAKPVPAPVPAPVPMPTGPNEYTCSWYAPYNACLKKKKYKWFECYHHYKAYCSKPLYRRALKEVETSELLAEHDTCADVSYNMFLVMEGAHMTGLATPVEAENCPNMIFHADVGMDQSMTKVAMTATTEIVSEAADDVKLHLGERPLARIVEAFESADVNKAGQKNNKLYDALTNNCVALLRNMADPLEIPVDKRMINFVSQRLLAESGSHIVDMIKDSPALSAVVGSGGRFLKGVGAETIVSKVIELYV